MPITHQPYSFATHSRRREAVSLITPSRSTPMQFLPYLIHSQPEPTLADLEEFLAHLAAQEDRWEDAEGAE